MKPPTTDALRYAAIVLGRDVTQLERLLDAANSPGGEGREQLRELLAHVRDVRTWIYGVQIPAAERRDARRAARKASQASVLPTRKPCGECGELMAYDHSVCFYCATGTVPASECSDCGSTLAHVVGPLVRGTVCPECSPDSALLDDDHEIDCRCSECGSAPIRPADLKLLKASVIGLIPRSPK